ncbi:MAG: NAD-dependent epimerase/dehydratase family protein [Chloroflexi bacterium]|nr:NAD-dependent epimerase/dehydratase family protein [Chloroflexota bacterium]
MRVVVTGGAGFIGSHLVTALLAAGDDVTALDNLHRGDRSRVPPAARFIEGDIRDATTVEAAIAGAEVVYHLAAQSNVMGAISDRRYSFTTNVAGTFALLESAAKSGVRRFVFASSREVYGEPASLPVAETAQLLARNPYGASKVAGEAYCRAWAQAGGLHCSILRFANVYGPGDRARVIPLWLERASAGEDLEVYGGDQVLDFVPVSTTVDSLLKAGACDLDGPVNVASGKGTTLVALSDRILTLVGGRSRLVRRPPRSAEVVRFVADVSRMRSGLGIEPPDDPLAALSELAAHAGAG